MTSHAYDTFDDFFRSQEALERFERLARDIITAVQRAHALGINPGGEVLCIPVPEEADVPSGAMDRLLNREELENYFGPVERDIIFGEDDPPSECDCNLDWPECRCRQIDVDQFDASGCAAHGEQPGLIDGLPISDYAREQIEILETLFAGAELLPIRCLRCCSDRETVTRDRTFLGTPGVACCGEE